MEVIDLPYLQSLAWSYGFFSYSKSCIVSEFYAFRFFPYSNRATEKIEKDSKK